MMKHRRLMMRLMQYLLYKFYRNNEIGIIQIKEKNKKRRQSKKKAAKNILNRRDARCA